MSHITKTNEFHETSLKILDAILTFKKRRKNAIKVRDNHHFHPYPKRVYVRQVEVLDKCIERLSDRYYKLFLNHLNEMNGEK